LAFIRISRFVRWQSPSTTQKPVEIVMRSFKPGYVHEGDKLFLYDGRFLG
jgi:hypothetical protein